MENNGDSNNQKRTTLVVFLTLLLLVILACFWMIYPYLLSIISGGILALLANPLYKKLRAKGWWPQVSSLIVTLGIVLLVIIPISIFISLAIKQGIAVAKIISETEALSLESIMEKLNNSPLVDIVGADPQELKTTAHGWIQSAGKTATGIILGIVAYLPNIILQLALASISCFFMLLDGNRFLLWMKDRIPLDNDVRKRVVNSFRDMAIASIWATLAAGAAQSAVIFLAYLILGVPGSYLAAGATFIFAWIPLLGSAPVWIVGAAYLYAQESFSKVIVMIIFGLLAGIIDNFVRPLVLKGRSNMHPLVSLVAIFGGIGLFGIMGVFLGPILAAVTISLLQIWPAVAQRFGLMSPSVEK